MQTILYTLVKSILILIVIGLLNSCGPVVVTSRIGNPPPVWFYPHRVEVVRYIYFPDLVLYFDLRTHSYLYRDGNVWRRQPDIPYKYRSLNLSKQRYERIQNYDRDDIDPFHNQFKNPRTKKTQN